MATKMTAVQAKLQATTVDFQKLEAGMSIQGLQGLTVRNVWSDRSETALGFAITRERTGFEGTSPLIRLVSALVHSF